MSRHHVVVGAGPVGRHVAAHLADRGEEVVVVTRSGRDTGQPESGTRRSTHPTPAH